MAEEIKQMLQEYRDGKISRREFIQKTVILTGSLAAANSLIGGLIPTDSHAAQVAETDPDILTHNVEYQGKAGPVFAYLARPMKAGKYPAIIVIHENAGLNDHVRDVARRFAKQGYVALAPDYLSRQGGTIKANPEGRRLGQDPRDGPMARTSRKTQQPGSTTSRFSRMFARTDWD